ncbi:MAG: hypothetical protein K1Y36_18325 [Blastocatellia bacterium]|nr:hypothetical protein [Blastocatellia bacterium]
MQKLFRFGRMGIILMKTGGRAEFLKNRNHLRWSRHNNIIAWQKQNFRVLEVSFDFVLGVAESEKHVAQNFLFCKKIRRTNQLTGSPAE